MLIKNLIYVNTSSQKDLSFEIIRRECGYMRVGALCPAFGLSRNTSLGKSFPAPCGVFIITDVFILVFKNN